MIGNTHKFKIEVDGTLGLLEPYNEQNHQALMVEASLHRNIILEVGLWRTIAEVLE